MQGIIEASDHTGCVAKGWVSGYIFDSLSVDPDLTPIAQAFQVFFASQGTYASCIALLRGRHQLNPFLSCCSFNMAVRSICPRYAQGLLKYSKYILKSIAEKQHTI